MAKYRAHQSFLDQLRHKKKKKKERKILLYGLSSVFCIAAAVYFFVFSQYFLIKSIAVEGTDLIFPDAVKQSVGGVFGGKRWWFLPSQNVFFFPVREAEIALRKEFPPLASISISRQPHFVRIGSWKHDSALKVRITERPRTALSCDASRCFFADDEGMLFSPAPAASGASVLRIAESDLSGVVLPDKKYSTDFIGFIKSAKVSAAGENILFDSFERVDDYGDIKAHADGNFNVFLTMSQDPKKQARILKEILTKMVQGDIARLDYVDLRVENRAYYKLKQ